MAIFHQTRDMIRAGKSSRFNYQLMAEYSVQDKVCSAEKRYEQSKAPGLSSSKKGVEI